MKRLAERLSSMQFTTGILIILMFWFAWGVLLAGSDTFSEGFSVMNSLLAPAWFSMPDTLPFLLKFWFVGLCFIVTILGINLIFCSWIKILRIMRNKQTASRFIMLIIHIVFGLVALGHFGSFVLGYRYENVKLQEGESFSLPEGYAVSVKKIQVEDTAMLYQPRREGASRTFHPEANFCEVAVIKDRAEVAQGTALFLRPFSYRDIQVTLKRFIPPKGKKNRDPRGLKEGVWLIVSRNPVKMFVFILFAVMIAGIGVYMVMTWRTRPTYKRNSL